MGLMTLITLITVMTLMIIPVIRAQRHALSQKQPLCMRHRSRSVSAKT